MLCLLCNEPLVIGKSLSTGEYGLTEVDIKTHCSKCFRLSNRIDLLHEKIINIKVVMKGHLKDVRNLKIEQSLLEEEIDYLYKNRPVIYNGVVQNIR